MDVEYGKKYMAKKMESEGLRQVQKYYDAFMYYSIAFVIIC